MSDELMRQAMERLADAAGECCGCNIANLPEWDGLQQAILKLLSDEYVAGCADGYRDGVNEGWAGGYRDGLEAERGND